MSDDASRQWFVIEVHGRWTDAEYEAMCEAVADATIALELAQPPEAGDAEVSGHALEGPPEWVTTEDGG